MNKYERGQIQRIDWLDRLAFKAMDKVKERESNKIGNSYLYLVVDFCSFEHQVVFQVNIHEECYKGSCYLLKGLFVFGSTSAHCLGNLSMRPDSEPIESTIYHCHDFRLSIYFLHSSSSGECFYIAQSYRPLNSV